MIRRNEAEINSYLKMLSDALWEPVEWLHDKFDPPKSGGASEPPARPILDGLIYHFRTSRQWRQILKVYGDDSTIHRAIQRWVRIGLFEMIKSLLQAECDEL
jgi:transposase